MNSGEKTLNVRVRIADRTLAQPVLRDLRLDRSLAVNIVRGRITKTETSLDLELRGSQGRIEQFIRRTAARGASIRPAPAGIA